MNAIAIHESAHAAMYLMERRKNARIVHLRVADDAGVCRVRTRSGLKFPHAVIAGYVGEMRALKGKDWTPTPEDFADCLHLDDIADAAALVGVEGLPQLWLEAAAMVDGAWHRIQALAAALQKAGTLSGEQVEAIWCDSAGAEVVWQ
jgi:hypothetical protein